GDIVFNCGVTAVTVSWLSSKECYVISGNKSGTRYILVNGSGGLYYAYADEEEETIVVPSVDMTSTNKILAAIYEQFYEYSYAQNALVDRMYAKMISNQAYLVTMLNDYFYPLVSSTEAMVGAIGQTLDLRLRQLVYSIQNIEEDTATMSTTLTEIKTLLETGIPVTGVDIGDVTVSTDLTNVEGYIDTVETKLTNIQGLLQRGLIAPSTQPYLSVISSNVDGLEGALSTIDSRLADIENAVYSNSTDAMSTTLTEIKTLLETGIPVTGVDIGDVTVSTDLTNVEGYIDKVESKLDGVNANLRIGQLPALVTINSGIVTTNNRLNDIYTRLESIEDAVLDAENTIIDITTDNDAFNIFYVEKTDGTSESVGETATDAAKVVGEFLSVFYRLIFADGLENADIIHDFEEVYTVTDSGVSVW
ncbi:MAG: hypothetical protein J6J23_00515, partial [Clostridia bacterium]|nr:hypothetical protein [Clostridia bacterium]